MTCLEARRVTATDSPGSPRRRPRILVVDDDAKFLARIQSWLAQRNLEFVCAQTCQAALLAPRRGRVDLALIDHRLRGRESGLTLAQGLHASYGIPFILMSQYFTTKLTVQAMKLGADNCIDKPIGADEMLRAIDAVLPKETFDYLRNDNNQADQQNGSDDLPDAESPVETLARVLLRACGAKKDPKTNSRLARAGGVSVRKYQELCSLCQLDGRAARDVTRILRAIRLSFADRSALMSHFNPGDHRTILQLFLRAGLRSDCQRVDLSTFFQIQLLIPRERELLRELAHLAANSPLFLDESWEDQKPNSTSVPIAD